MNKEKKKNKKQKANMHLFSFQTAFPSSMFSLLVLFFVQILQVEARNLNLNKSGVPSLLVFGDSLVDPGNNNMLPTLAKSNFPPYGREFIGHRPTGRFSNGKIATDLLASELGIKELLPAYLDPDLKPQDLLTGVSFASAGTGYDSLTAKILSVLSMKDQLEMFKEYKEKVKAIAGERRAAYIISKSLYIICAGNNDLVFTYFESPLRRAQYDLPSYLNFLVQTASSFLQDLYHLGARRVAILGLPPLGCLPSQRTLAGGPKRECVASYNQASMDFNSKLETEMNLLNTKLPGLTIVYIDFYTSANRIIQNPSSYGFEQVNKGCCGTGTVEYAVLCNEKNPYTCVDDSKYVFWDSFHPTQQAYEAMIPELVQNYLPRIL